MKNLICQCESPSIILNPHLKDIVLKYGHYYINGYRSTLSNYQKSHWFEQFPYSMFGKIKRSIQVSDELSNYYVLADDGEEIPLFFQVPCGKCSICRDKKANEWVTRAMCETQTSSNVPYFITLTYNDLNTPKNGVRKRAAQLFMKRLRINLSRYVGHDVNLRFFLCAEYGSKSGRPHYHALLWNVPQIKEDELLTIVENSWSYMVSKERYDKIPSTLDKYGKYVYKFYDKDNKRYRVRYGFVCMSQCNEHRVRYCMKYMRKDGDVPIGKNDVFFLSSRRRGLGYEWITSKVQEFRDNPQIFDVLLFDKFTGEKYQGCIPRYFKDIIAPPPSKLIKKEIRDTFKYYNWLYNKACSMIGTMYTPHQRVLSHYPTLQYHVARLPRVVNENLSLYSGLYIQDNYDKYTSELFKLCDELECRLLQYEYDFDLATFVPGYKREHLFYLETLMSHSIETIFDKVSRLSRQRVRSRNREVL